MNSFERKLSSQGLVELSVGRLRLLLSPSVGGAISAFEWTDADAARPILRESPSRLERSLDACNFPLVPYVNRIRGGSFRFRGRDVKLRPNMARDPSPLHGQGWLSAWTVERRAEQDALLSYRHETGEWPWTYEARQHFLLDDGGLTLTLSCRNLSDEPMPCGLGQHPYFPCGPQTILDTYVQTAWTVDERVLPVAEVPAEGHYGLKDRLICGQGLDNGFAGWSGLARLKDPSWPYELQLSSSTAQFFQVYSPAQGGIVVAEPVTHANAALNAPEKEWPGLGLRVLVPGEEMRMTMRLDVIAR